LSLNISYHVWCYHSASPKYLKLWHPNKNVKKRPNSSISGKTCFIIVVNPFHMIATYLNLILCSFIFSVYKNWIRILKLIIWKWMIFPKVVCFWVFTLQKTIRNDPWEDRIINHYRKSKNWTWVNFLFRK
jgi:hypothetical protein